MIIAINKFLTKLFKKHFFVGIYRPLIELFASNSYLDFVIYDYPGYGLCKGEPNEQSLCSTIEVYLLAFFSKEID